MQLPMFSSGTDGDHQGDRVSMRVGEGGVLLGPSTCVSARLRRCAELPAIQQPVGRARDSEADGYSQNLWRAADHGEAIQ